jgi:hypothetical protein
MKSILRRILENEDTFNSLYHKKNKWIEIEGIEKKILSRELFDLIEKSYTDIGGHFEIRSSDDIMNFPIIKAIDLDDDNYSDVVKLSKMTKYGEKSLASGSDGNTESKRELLRMKARELFHRGHYAEVSGKFAEILLNKFNVPYVNNKQDVETVLNKDVEWIGDGWYKRNISSAGNHKKILVGIPKGI